MRAAFFRKHGGPEVLEVGELPAPVASPGEVLVRVRTVALNHMDLWVRRGLPTLKLPMPHVAGCDVCGVIEALGDGVAGLAVGDRVVVNPGVSCGRCESCLSGADQLCERYHLIGESRWGGEAELVAVPAANVVTAPHDVADETLAALPVTYLTAWNMLAHRARLRPGETVLVWGAGSGVGVAAIQIAKVLGARVIACASRDDKLRRAREQGADAALLAGRPGVGLEGRALVAEVRRLTDGRGVDVVFEHTGAATFPQSVRLAARGGRIVTCGATSGPETPLDLRHVFWRQLSILGATMAPKGALHRLLLLVREGRLAPVVDRVWPLDRIADAHRALEAGETFGKIVLRVSATP